MCLSVCQVGPIPVEDLLGKDVVSLFSSDVRNGRALYTDSNAREFIARSLYVHASHNDSLQYSLPRCMYTMAPV